MEAPKTTARKRRAKATPAASAAGSTSPDLNVQTLVLPADLRIAAATQVYGELTAVDAASPLIVDASAVTKVDAAGVQAVFAGLRARSDAGSPWSWQSPSDAFCRAVRLLGLQSSMVLPSC